MVFWLIAVCLLSFTESRLVGHAHRNGATSSINKFLSHLRSLLSEDPDPDGLDDGLGKYTVAIIVIVSSVFLIILIAWGIYRYKQWIPRTKRRGSKTGIESDPLVPPSSSGGPSTVVVPESASTSNIFTRK